ncbi:MAG TPA: RidA family protein [Stellaceae bacterium]|nr:RidA family protein [Stellaceae bacterium]
MADVRRQQSIDVDGIAHGAPIPVASRVGNVIATSAISGRDPKTGKLAPDADGQARLAFENLKTILATGGMGLGDVVKITVFLTDDGFRDAVNKYWLECYPDAAKRPARHAITLPLRGGVLLQIDALAVAQG